MLTYACINKPEHVMRSPERKEHFSETAWTWDTTLVFEGDNLVLVFNNRPIWHVYWHVKCRDARAKNLSDHWSRYVERHIRLMLKLKARHRRVNAKRHLTST